MAAGEEEVPSRRRTVTVMFTDIVEFTPQAESLPEQETAALLNHHFALLGACIEHEHGMIDKYSRRISVMAWRQSFVTWTIMPTRLCAPRWPSWL